jgi:hypothetical protein
MAGSEAEERIRAKAETMLRRLWPSGRVIHELGTGSYGPSVIDVACVTPDMLIGIEVKSERDVLGRLERQFAHARRVCDLYALCAAPVMARKVSLLQDPHIPGEWRDIPRQPGCRGPVPNPKHLPGLVGLEVIAETEDGFDTTYTWASETGGYNARARLQPALLNPADRLEMLWAEELRTIASPLGIGPRSNRFDSIRAITEALSGRDIRRAVCAALRSRTFVRADQEQAA